MKAARFLLAFALAAACAPEPPPVSLEPRFLPEQWFQGRTLGEGEFRRILGGAPGRFDMVVEGSRDGAALILDETFISERGRWNRVWTITPKRPGAYVGRLTTGQGPAAVRVAGDTVRMRYRAQAPLVDRPFVARFEQSLRLRPDGTVLNVADVYKWGVRIGRSTVIFRKADPTSSEETD